MVKSKSFCFCGSGKSPESCCKKSPQIKVYTKHFANPDERKEMFDKLKWSSEFNMRNRGLFEFYGNELIAYKRQRPSDKHRNEFLRVFSNYLTDYLEDTCPPSWHECRLSFWKELLTIHYPRHIKISQQNTDVETFLYQLKKFVRWLDKTVGTSWYGEVVSLCNTLFDELKTCERLINFLTLYHFPDIHNENWDITKDLGRIEQEFHYYDTTREGLFQVTSVIEDILLLEEVESKRIFYIKDLSCNHFVSGICLKGMIGKRKNDLYWTWCSTESVYPPSSIDVPVPV